MASWIIVGMSGFDWLNIPINSSGASSPAPPVTFGGSNEQKEQGGLANRPHYVTKNEGRGVGKTRLLNEDEDDTSIPLSLKENELTLEEFKTYMRWYNDILARLNTRTVSLLDVFAFMANFRLPQWVKERISSIFAMIGSSINIGEFFALLRLIAHATCGRKPTRRLLKVHAPVPLPPSILNKKRPNDEELEDSQAASDNHGGNAKFTDGQKPNNQLDIEGFTQFMLTGERPEDGGRKFKKSRKTKSVKFSDQIVTDIHDTEPMAFLPPQAEEIDYNLPMNQLLDRLKQLNHADEEERRILEDMEPQINHFQNLNSVDAVSIDGVPEKIDPVNQHSQFLHPNAAGHNQPLGHHSPSPQRMPSPQKPMEQSVDPNQQHSSYNLSPQPSGQPMAPDLSDPLRMLEIFNPSPLDRQQHLMPMPPNHTGPPKVLSYNNSPGQNSMDDHQMKPLKPNITGPIDMSRKIGASSDPQEVPRISLQSLSDQLTGNTFSNTLQNSGASETDLLGHDMPMMNNNWTASPPVPMKRNRSVSSPISSGNNLHDNDIPSNLHASLGSPRGGLHTDTERVLPPPPPPSRKTISHPPPLPPKTPMEGQPATFRPELPPRSNSNTRILDDLKALQEEVDRIRDMTGGF